MKKNVVILMYNFPPIGAGRGIAWTYFASKIAEDYDVNIITINASISDPLYNSSKLNLVNDSYKVSRTTVGKFYSSLYPDKKKKTNSEPKDDHLLKSYNVAFKKYAVLLYKNIIKSVIFPDRMIFWNNYAYNEFKSINKKKKSI